MAVNATLRKATKSDFEKSLEVESGNSPAPEIPAGTNLPVPASPSAAALYSAATGGGFSGDFDQSDDVLPTLKIVNGSGPLSEEFPQGALVLDGVQLFDRPNLKEPAKNPALLFVPVVIQKQYRENLSEDEIAEGAFPRVLNSRAEAVALGGGIGWQNGARGRWSESAKCFLLIQQPEGVAHPRFDLTLDGKVYAPCVYYNSGMAYKGFTKKIWNSKGSLLVNGIPYLAKYVWQWRVAQLKARISNRTTFGPEITMTSTESGPELRERSNTMIETPPPAKAERASTEEGAPGEE